MRLCAVGEPANLTAHIVAPHENPMQLGYRSHAERAEMGALFHIGGGRRIGDGIPAVPYGCKCFRQRKAML